MEIDRDGNTKHEIDFTGNIETPMYKTLNGRDEGSENGPGKEKQG